MRFRFKVREEDPLGVLPLLGIQIHWATPAHGQAKPIERAFRDLASDVAKDPCFAGAYVGNRPDAKPENYGKRLVRYKLVVADYKLPREGRSIISLISTTRTGLRLCWEQTSSALGFNV
ncbi:transposase domain-containing protein [Pseudophaeobacter flagellatus]|uniref:transposase domain-containing protein n=1 Tax=Pseudophaeobacter flagellatus TaxID=2899119 RepID=UPI002FCAEA8E